MQHLKIVKASQVAEPLAQREIKFQVIDEDTNQIASLKFRHSRHSFIRAAQRGIDNDKISATLKFGDNFFKQGLIYYVLGENNIPESLSKESKKLQNTVVVVSGDSDEVITCYRSKNPFKHLKKKSKQLYKNYNTAA